MFLIRCGARPPEEVGDGNSSVPGRVAGHDDRVERHQRDREAFQEVDYSAFFGAFAAFLFVALLCQVLISGTSVECWLRRDLPRPQRFTWLALSLAGLASAGIALPYPPLLLATAAAVVANLLWQSAPAHRLARLDMQLAWDALFLTELFFFTGGSANPLVSLYLLLIALSALTQSPRTTRALALACVLAYGALFVWHRPLPPVPGGTDMLIALHLAGMWLTFAASAWVIGGPLARLALTLRRREQEIARLRENQLRDEQLVALGMLAASAAHELGTPLNTLTLLCDDWQAAPPAAGMEDDLVLMRDQQIGRASCRERVSSPV